MAKPESGYEFGQREIQAYLANRQVVVLATVNPDAGPLAMPMWFVHDHAQLAMISVDGLAKVRNLERDPRVCVVAEGGTAGAVDGMVLAGTVAFLEGAERTPWGERFRLKYAPRVERLWAGRALPDDRRVFAFRPRVVAAWGL